MQTLPMLAKNYQKLSSFEDIERLYFVDENLFKGAEKNALHMLIAAPLQYQNFVDTGNDLLVDAMRFSHVSMAKELSIASGCKVILHSEILAGGEEVTNILNKQENQKSILKLSLVVDSEEKLLAALQKFFGESKEFIDYTPTKYSKGFLKHVAKVTHAHNLADDKALIDLNQDKTIASGVKDEQKNDLIT